MSKNATIILYGLPAVGKSTVAAILRQGLDVSYIKIDDIWAECFERPKYTPAESAIVFSSLVNQVTSELEEGKDLLIEGVFASKERITIIEDICDSFDCDCIKVLLDASLPVLDARLQKRNRPENSQDISRKQREMLRRTTDSQEYASLIVDTDDLTAHATASAVYNWLTQTYKEGPNSLN